MPATISYIYPYMSFSDILRRHTTNDYTTNNNDNRENVHVNVNTMATEDNNNNSNVNNVNNSNDNVDNDNNTLLLRPIRRRTRKIFDALPSPFPRIRETVNGTAIIDSDDFADSMTADANLFEMVHTPYAVKFANKMRLLPQKNTKLANLQSQIDAHTCNGTTDISNNKNYNNNYTNRSNNNSSNNKKNDNKINITIVPRTENNTHLSANDQNSDDNNNENNKMTINRSVKNKPHVNTTTTAFSSPLSSSSHTSSPATQQETQQQQEDANKFTNVQQQHEHYDSNNNSEENRKENSYNKSSENSNNGTDNTNNEHDGIVRRSESNSSSNNSSSIDTNSEYSAVEHVRMQNKKRNSNILHKFVNWCSHSRSQREDEKFDVELSVKVNKHKILNVLDGGYVVFTDAFIDKHKNSSISSLSLAYETELRCTHSKQSSSTDNTSSTTSLSLTATERAMLSNQQSRLQRVRKCIEDVQQQRRPLFRRRNSDVIYGRAMYISANENNNHEKAEMSTHEQK